MHITFRNLVYYVLLCVDLSYVYYLFSFPITAKEKPSKMNETLSTGPETFRQAFEDVVVILSDGNQTLMQKCLKCGFIVRNHAVSIIQAIHTHINAYGWESIEHLVLEIQMQNTQKNIHN